jgi:threonylcarbamoyladenosine tRNA methylthiotransferase CDKAL1
MKVYVETYGCSNSISEAESISGLLKMAGFEIIQNEAKADLIVLVTCYVKAPTEQKILQRISGMKSKKLIVAGCMPEGIRDKLIANAPHASMVSTHHIKEIARAAKETLRGNRVEYVGKSKEVNLCIGKVRRNPVIGIIPISKGCNSSCTYCCVRHAKGSLQSYPKSMIIEEAKAALKEGCRELWLTAQDAASYNFKEKLPTLIKEITDLKGEFMTRIGMMNPKNLIPIKDEMIEVFKNPKLYSFIHMPIQSGSDNVLSSMNRGYKASEAAELFESFRKNLRCQLWTDAIVGYPTESEDDFIKTVEFVKKIRPDWVNVSKFGRRPNTEASKLKALPTKVVNERSKELSELARRISLERNKEWLGAEGNVLISEKGRKGQWIGKNSAYKSVVISSRDNLMGNLMRVRIVDFSNAFLVGEIV